MYIEIVEMVVHKFLTFYLLPDFLIYEFQLEKQEHFSNFKELRRTMYFLNSVHILHVHLIMRSYLFMGVAALTEYEQQSFRI